MILKSRHCTMLGDMFHDMLFNFPSTGVSIVDRQLGKMLIERFKQEGIELRFDLSNPAYNRYVNRYSDTVDHVHMCCHVDQAFDKLAAVGQDIVNDLRADGCIHVTNIWTIARITGPEVKCWYSVEYHNVDHSPE